MKKLNQDNLKKWGRNTLIFVAPTLAIFFLQLAKGVDFKLALPLALFAFWQSLADYFGKLSKQK